MINAIKKSFQKLIQQLRNPRLRLLRTLLVSHEEPTSLEVPWPPLPDAVREFYSSIECLHCQWALAEPIENLRYLDEGLDIISGEVCLPSLKKLPEKQDPAAFLSYLDPCGLLSSFHAKEELLHYIPLDYLSSHLAAAYRAGESKPETLFLIDFSESGQITLFPWA